MLGVNVVPKVNSAIGQGWVRHGLFLARTSAQSLIKNQKETERRWGEKKKKNPPLTLLFMSPNDFTAAPTEYSCSEHYYLPHTVEKPKKCNRYRYDQRAVPRLTVFVMNSTSPSHSRLKILDNYGTSLFQQPVLTVLPAVQICLLFKLSGSS